jgi:hypothetical protein
VEYEAGMTIKPGSPLRMPVWTVIVEDHVNDFAHRHLGLKGV